MDTFEQFSTLRALVVDDDPVICEGLAMALEDEGFDVTMRMRPDDALEADIDEPHLAFIDVIMPGMDGLELATELKKRWPDMEIVFVSGAASTDNIIRAMQLGAYDFMVKPFQAGDLRLCLTRFHERLTMKRRLLLAEERHAALIQNIPVLIFRLREDLQLDFINHACAPMLGFDPETALKTDNWFLSRVRMKDRGQVKNVLKNAFGNNYPISVQCRLVHRKGFDVHGIIKTLPAPPTEQGTPPLIDGTFVDISQRVIEEQFTLQDEKLKTIGAISEEVAHEIRNPLMSISGFARRLSLKAPDFPETEIILRESQRIEKLLDRIRNYLAPRTASFSAVDIEELTQEALREIEPALTDQNVTVVTDFEAGLAPVSADKELLREAIHILLGDAVQVLAAWENLRIQTYSAGNSVHLTVDYELSGMKNIDPDKIYLPYEEGGFGIPNCYRLIKQMGGMLTMTRMNGYAVFNATLPKWEVPA